MTRPAWMLEIGRTAWRLHARQENGVAPATCQEFGEQDLVLQAPAIQEALTLGGYRGEPILLALESSWCLAATLVVGRPQELRDRQTMLYRLEESIPWGVEDCVADYLGLADCAFMVAVPAAPLAEFVRQLEAAGVQIQSIAPTALLAAAEHLERETWPERHVVLLKERGWIDLVYIEGTRPIAWAWLSAEGPALGRELKRYAVQAGTKTQLVGYGLDESLARELETSSAIELTAAPAADDESPTSLALAAADRVLGGQRQSPIELKQSAFGRTRGHVALRRYALAVQVAVAALVLSLIGTFVYRGYAAGRQADLVAAQQAEVFRSVFPNARVPVGVRSRLESELSQLKGLQAEDVAVPMTVPAATMLHRLLTALPTDRRFRFLEIRIEQGRLYLDGEVRSHSDAEAIAQRLRTQEFEVAPPRTQRLDAERVSLRITATLPSSGTPAPRSTK